MLVNPMVGFTGTGVSAHSQFPPIQLSAMVRIMAKKPLEPLIPLDELKQVLAKIVNAPKEKVERAKAKTKPKKKS
jgi:hypothetical protein